MSFLCGVIRPSLRDRVRSSVTWREFKVDLLFLHFGRCGASDDDASWVKIQFKL